MTVDDRGEGIGEISDGLDVVQLGGGDDRGEEDVVGAILMEQNDEWALQRCRYMTLETIAPLRDDLALTLPTAAT